jgi:hypothetical protein
MTGETELGRSRRTARLAERTERMAREGGLAAEPTRFPP